MIQAKDVQVQDQGFFWSINKVNGVSRETLTIALAGGIDDAALEALKEGPVTVCDQAGQVTASFPGPLKVVSLQLVLARETPEEDVAALTAQLADLRTALNEAESAKESAELALQAAKDAETETEDADNADSL